MPQSDLERSFAFLYKILKVPPPVTEHMFCKGRKWRFDFAWPDYRIAFEVEGGTFSGGRHTRGKGFENDIEKYNAATCLGWKVLRVTKKHIDNGMAAQWLGQAFNGHPHGFDRPLYESRDEEPVG